MATYVISDIHGEYDMFTELLETIGLKRSDTLYILGDVLDRGPHPIKTMLKLMEMENVVCIVGNHEVMAVECLDFLMKEITDLSLEELDREMLENLLTWQYNGCQSTVDEFRKLDDETKQEVIDFIKEFRLYEEVFAGGRDYLLVHAGLGNFSPDKDLEDYTVDELVWERADYNVKYFDDTFVVSGHTPTQVIKGNPAPGFVFRKNNHIAIDCGAHYPGGRLAALCLETGEVFYAASAKARG